MLISLLFQAKKSSSGTSLDFNPILSELFADNFLWLGSLSFGAAAFTIASLLDKPPQNFNKRHLLPLGLVVLASRVIIEFLPNSEAMQNSLTETPLYQFLLGAISTCLVIAGEVVLTREMANSY